MGSFKRLYVWSDAMDLAEKAYLVCSIPPLSKDYGLRNQIQKSAVSIPSNIAEGDERGSNPQSVYHFNVAKGSAAELLTQLEIAYRVGYLEKKCLTELEKKIEKVRSSLIKLIKARGG
jgi:four helix bundle protein